ncbi:MAG: hypothetical protein ACR2P4_03715, partial [Gammaproteobacteria bacterium]
MTILKPVIPAKAGISFCYSPERASCSQHGATPRDGITHISSPEGASHSFAGQSPAKNPADIIIIAAIVFGRPFRACLFNTPIHGALPRAMNRSPFQGFY